MAVAESLYGKPTETPISPEYKGAIIGFEGVAIQWDKGQWEFDGLLGRKTKPVFSILNPGHWEEIAELLSQGKTAAGMMMGVYGVFKKLDRKDPESADVLFNRVKQRPPSQNFVALVHPKDIMKFVDKRRLGKVDREQLRRKEGRLELYVGPQHVILPVRENRVNPALVQEKDRTIACFWVPGHYGFEGLVNQARKKIRRGLLGGGSLNIHGKEPSYDKKSLYQAIAGQPEWLEEIDFVITDDIAEAAGIGRSHTMVRYGPNDKDPEIVRIGSISPEKIRKAAGRNIIVNEETVRRASSTTPYTPEDNAIIDTRVGEALLRTQRFGDWIEKSL